MSYFVLEPRALLPEDSQGTRALLMTTLGVTPYIDRALEVLTLAERGNDPEHRAIVIARDGTVAALALYGRVAGTQHAARLHMAVLGPSVEANDVGARLMDAVANAARDAGAGFILAELPDDLAIGSVFALLRDYGFEEETRIPDFYRQGAALVFLRLAL